MGDITTLQQRIQQECAARAKKDAHDKVWGPNSLFWRGDIQFKSGTQSVTVSRYEILNEIQAAVEKHLYKEYVDQRTKAIIEAVDNLAQLTSEVQDLQNG